MPLNMHSPIPLYRQLAERIRSEIADGSYAVAARIPSENELAGQYAIGRPTVRQATDLLVRQGLLERRRGSGTYVRPPSRSIDLFSLAGTSAALKKTELDTTLELVAGPLHMPANPERGETLCIERKASVGGVPVLFETLWFDAELFAGLEKHALENQSLSALVRDVFFLEPTSADQTFFVISANDTQAGQLDVDVGTPLLRVHRDLHFADHRSALDADIVCRTDCFEFTQTLYPAQAGQDDLIAANAPESLSL